MTAVATYVGQANALTHLGSDVAVGLAMSDPTQIGYSYRVPFADRPALGATRTVTIGPAGTIGTPTWQAVVTSLSLSPGRGSVFEGSVRVVTDHPFENRPGFTPTFLTYTCTPENAPDLGDTIDVVIA